VWDDILIHAGGARLLQSQVQEEVYASCQEKVSPPCPRRGWEIYTNPTGWQIARYRKKNACIHATDPDPVGHKDLEESILLLRKIREVLMSTRTESAFALKGELMQRGSEHPRLTTDAPFLHRPYSAVYEASAEACVLARNSQELYVSLARLTYHLYPGIIRKTVGSCLLSPCVLVQLS
jgi:hypothetical protein